MESDAVRSTNEEERSSLDSISQPLAADSLWVLKKIWAPIRSGAPVIRRGARVVCPHSMSIMQLLCNFLVALPPWKKLMPAEEEVEIRKSIAGAYKTVMMRKALTVAQLNDMWCRIKMLEEDMQESQDKPHPSCCKYGETIGSLKAEFRSLLSFVAPNLRCTCQLQALIREVFRGRDLERAQVSMGSDGESIGVESWADSLNLSAVNGGGDTDRKMLKDRLFKLRVKYREKKERELEEVMDISSLKRWKEADCDQEGVNSLMFQFSSMLRSFTANAIQLRTFSHHSFKNWLLDLLREVNDDVDLVMAPVFTGYVGHGRAPIFTGLAGEDSTSTIFDTENPTDGFLIGDAAIHLLHGNTANTSIASFGIGSTTQMGKMKAESYKVPLLPQKNNQARELEDLSNFAFLGLIMCYAVLYFLYSAFLGKNGGHMRVMTGLHIWTALLMLILFIGSFIRFSVGTLKVIRFVMSGLLLLSSSIAFVLLQLSL